MNPQEEAKIVLIFDYLCVEEKSMVTSWTFSESWIVLGTLAGSIILYSKHNPKRGFILGFPDLMEAKSFFPGTGLKAGRGTWGQALRLRPLGIQ